MMNSEPAQSESTPYPAEWSTWTRRVALVILLLGLVVGLFLFRPVLTALLLSLILVSILIHPVRALARRTRIPYALSAILVFLLFLVLATALILFLSAPMVGIVRDLMTQIEVGVTRFIEFLATYTPDQGWLVDEKTGEKIINLNFILEPLSILVKDEITSQDQVVAALERLESLATTVTGTASTIGSVLGNLALVALLTLIMLLELPASFRWAIGVAPEGFRREYGILMARIGRLWNRYLGSTLILATALGVLNGLQLTLLGVPSAALVGVLTGIFGLIPMLGGLLALVPIMLVPLLEGSTLLSIHPLALALLAGGINLVIQAIIWQGISPKLYGDAVSVPVTLMLLGVVVGTVVGGVLGAFLVAPILGIIREIVEYVLKKVRGGDPYPGVPEPAFLTAGLLGPPKPTQRAREGAQSELM